MAGDYSRVHRLLRLIVLMQQGLAGNAAELARQFNVAERTIYRDLEVLTSLGISYGFDEEAGGYRIGKDFFLPPLHLSPDEALALLALSQTVGQSDQIPFTGPAARAIEKIRGQLPERVLHELGDLDRHITVQLPASGPDSQAIKDTFGLVKEAIRTKRKLHGEYESLNSDAERGPFVFRPYALSFDQRAWYAIGYHEGREDVRRLKLNRFTALRLTDQPYSIPDDFSVDAFRGQAWRMVRSGQLHAVAIHFDPLMAETVSDTNWHPTQQIELHDDGSITFTCEVDGLDEIVWWVLSYGPHARVLQPAKLRERVARLLQAAGERYDGGQTSDGPTNPSKAPDTD